MTAKTLNVLSQEELSGWWEKIQAKVDQMIKQMGDKSPHVSAAGVYDDMKVDWWTSGFWPGLLWVMHDMTGKQHYRDAAWSWDERIEQAFLRENRFHHDVGFQFLPTAVIKYKLTGDADGKRRGLQAANFLAGRFNPVGNFIRAWNQPERPGWSIIDTMMNVSILFWAAQELGDARFAHVGKLHADTVINKVIRPDGSVPHITVFDPETGDVLEYVGGQGYSPTSSWSRGQAWAIYGMANTYKYTGDKRYLEAAQRVAHYFISCLPEDSVSHWDFRVPNLTGEPRDTSATSCAASGFLEIAEHLPEEEGRIYRTAAEKMLRSLTEHYSTLDRLEYEGILLEGTGAKPANSNVNVSLIYGDYFYAEAVSKLLGWSHHIF